MLEFGDGTSADTDGEVRIEKTDSGWCVIGRGLYLPADDEAAAQALLEQLRSQEIFFIMKMMKSPGFRYQYDQYLARLEAEAQAKAESPAASSGETTP